MTIVVNALTCRPLVVQIDKLQICGLFEPRAPAVVREAPWVAGDEVDGAGPVLCAELELRRVGYVLAIGCDRRVPAGAGPIRADELAAGLPRRALIRRGSPR
ncbi:hypothetical protein CFP66_18290 [Pseudonocardia sp. MH-G8]|nr:hypothetical protein CFP66_18290 [Pseudonocardia sp. MH-G8]